jgi:hypothetical protein
LEWIPETEKGRTRNEFTPLSMYLRDCRAATLIRSRPGPIGGRSANSVRRSPEFIARTVLLPERFRVDCAVGGDTVALSHSRRDYNAPGARLARQSSLASVVAVQRKGIAGRCAALQLCLGRRDSGVFKRHAWPRRRGPPPRRGPCRGAALRRDYRGLGCSRGQQSLASRERGGRPGAGGPCVGCRFFLHLSYLERFVNY